MRGLFAAAIAAAVLVWIFWPKSPHFTKEDIAQTQSDIRKTFEERKGIRVVDVKLLKESNRKLIGYAKIESDDLKELAKVLGNSTRDGTITKSCSATMADDWQWVWRCE
jgi:gamma-glutamylcysteine synthetase